MRTLANLNGLNNTFLRLESRFYYKADVSDLKSKLLVLLMTLPFNNDSERFVRRVKIQMTMYCFLATRNDILPNRTFKNKFHQMTVTWKLKLSSR